MMDRAAFGALILGGSAALVLLLPMIVYLMLGGTRDDNWNAAFATLLAGVFLAGILGAIMGPPKGRA